MHRQASPYKCQIWLAASWTTASGGPPPGARATRIRDAPQAGDLEGARARALHRQENGVANGIRTRDFQNHNLVL